MKSDITAIGNVFSFIEIGDRFYLYGWFGDELVCVNSHHYYAYTMGAWRVKAWREI